MPGTVTVACKIPNGLVLQTYDWETVTIPVMAGGVKDVKMAKATPWTQRLNGPARKLGQDVGHTIVHGAGLTHGVDADMFAVWLSQYKDTEIVRNGLVFAQVKAADTVAQANEHRNEKSGFEPVDPKNLPPEFKHKIETATTV
jgi:hypothetical protein